MVRVLPYSLSSGISPDDEVEGYLRSIREQGVRCLPAAMLRLPVRGCRSAAAAGRAAERAAVLSPNIAAALL